jgi:Tol biopolymer transport system component
MSGRDGNMEIYVMRADGSEQTRLTTNDTLDTHPTWSSNGSRIAFARTDQVLVPAPAVFVSPEDPTVSAIVAIRADGSDPRELTRRGINLWPDYGRCR